MWVGLWRKLIAKELLLLNCGVEEDSWQFLGLQGDPTSHPKGDQSWVFFGRNDAKLKRQYFGHLMWRFDSLEKTLMLWGTGGAGEGEDRGWDGWMASLTQWTWFWLNSRSWWWTRRPACCNSCGCRVGHDWVTELHWGGSSHKKPAYQCRRHKRHGFNPWVGKIPWRRKWQPTPVFLPGESHGQRSLVGYSSCSRRVRSYWSNLADIFTSRGWKNLYCFLNVYSALNS